MNKIKKQIEQLEQRLDGLHRSLSLTNNIGMGYFLETQIDVLTFEICHLTDKLIDLEIKAL